MVYETFVAPIPDKLTINHKDENKTNNCVWNLEVMTRGENTNYGTRNQRASEARSIVVYCLDKNYRLIKKYKGYHEYEAEGFDKHSVGRCCMGKLDYYKGYLWLYENDYYKLCKGEAEEIMTARKKMREEYLIWQRNSKNRYYHTVLKNSSKYKQRVKEICAKRRKIHA